MNGIATSTYSIDNTPSLTTIFTGGNYLTLPDGFQSHLQLYQSPVVPDGPHTLTITVSNITNGSPKYYLDFFTVDVSAVENTSQAIIDDTNQGINYVGNWTESHAYNEYLATDHKAPSSGNANATYTFNGIAQPLKLCMPLTNTLPFTGTSVSVYGSIITTNDPPTQIGFYIDSELVTEYTAPPAPNITRNVKLFSKSGLSAGLHTLLIVGQPSSSWWFDYLIYSPGSNAASSSPPLTNQGTGTGASSSSTPAPPVGPIVGGVVGGLVLLSCIGITLLVLRRRRQREDTLLAASVVPLDRPAVKAGNSLFPKEKSYPPASASPGRDREIDGREEQINNGSGVAAGSATRDGPTNNPLTGPPRNNPGSPTAHSGRHTEIGREVDGGVRLASGDSDDDHVPTLLPPSYARY